MAKFLDSNGLSHFWDKIKSYITERIADSSTTVDLSEYVKYTDTATSDTSGVIKIGYSENDKNYPVELSEDRAYVNVPWTDTTYDVATEDTNGLMSAEDKEKLDSLSDENISLITTNLPALNSVTHVKDANCWVYTSNLVSLAFDCVSTNGSSSSVSLHYLPIPTATTTTTGVMSAEDKTKLDSIAENADVTTVSLILTTGTAIATVNDVTLYAPVNESSGEVITPSATATATSLESTASATANVNVNGSTYEFTFGIPRGADGADGQDGTDGNDGAAAGFGTPTATANTLAAGLDATVSVAATGADTAKVFSFTFGIPRGADGEAGTDGVTPSISIAAIVDNLSSDSPTCTVSKSGTDANPVFTFTFSGLKGKDGESASSASVTWDDIVALFNANGFTLSTGELHAQNGFYED